MVSRALLLSAILSLVIFSPVILWNYYTEYSGINFHAERVGNDSFLPTLSYFFSEFFGQFFYNNPFNIYLIALSLIFIYKKRKEYLNREIAFLFCVGLPLILVTLGMSFFNRTLPHWSGPGYFSLILIAAYVFRQKSEQSTKKSLNRIIVISHLFFIVVITVALIQVRTNVIPLGETTREKRVGKGNPVVDLTVWEIVASEIDKMVQNDIKNRDIAPDHVILTHKWYPAGHLDYYYAVPRKTRLYVLGNSKSQHHYMRINALRGQISTGTDAYYITTSHHYKAPQQELLQYFDKFDGPEIIPIYKNKKKMLNVFIWRMTNLEQALSLQH